MSTVLVTATPGTFPSGFCPTGPNALQELYNAIINRTVFSLSADKAFYNYGDTQPTPDNRVFPWFRTSAKLPDRWYVYALGKWISPYRIPIGQERMIWGDGEVALWSYDGGDGTDPVSIGSTQTTGSFWKRDITFDGRSPMGIGAISGSNPAKSLVLAEQYGLGSVALQVSEIPAHAHTITAKAHLDINASSLDRTLAGAGAEFTDSFNTGSVGGGIAHQNVHPVTGVIVAQRTNRQFWTS
ncbi:MAG: hypothetical protein H0U18_17750 [Pyrinomonadaceae bacterium]|nr:hypothetical protein [Pyrinomonadaceae bacterium]